MRMTRAISTMNGKSVFMAKFKFTGIEEYTDSLRKIGAKNAKAVIRYAVYPGAKVVADAIHDEIASNHHRYGDLEESLTLSKMRDDDGFINTKVTFTGYDRKGVPNAIKAAVLESGRSDGRQDGTHFISRTVRAVSEKAISEMSKALDNKIGQIMEG